MHPKVGFNGLTASKVPCKSVELTWICSSCLKEQEECGCVWERPVGGTHSGLAQTGAYSRDHSASVSSSLLQRQGGEFLWNHAITLNLTTLSKHNWTKLDRWERDRRKRWSFTADTIQDKNTLASVLWEHTLCRNSHWHIKSTLKKYLSEMNELIVHSLRWQHPAVGLHCGVYSHRWALLFNCLWICCPISEHINWGYY